MGWDVEDGMGRVKPDVMCTWYGDPYGNRMRLLELALV